MLTSYSKYTRCANGQHFVQKTGECVMCDAGFYLAGTGQPGKTCSGGMYKTDAMTSMCIKCPTVGSCPRTGKSAGLFVPPNDGGTWLLASDGACLLTGVNFVS